MTRAKRSCAKKTARRDFHQYLLFHTFQTDRMNPHSNILLVAVNQSVRSKNDRWRYLDAKIKVLDLSVARGVIHVIGRLDTAAFAARAVEHQGVVPVGSFQCGVDIEAAAAEIEHIAGNRCRKWIWGHGERRRRTPPLPARGRSIWITVRRVLIVEPAHTARPAPTRPSHLLGVVSRIVLLHRQRHLLQVVLAPVVPRLGPRCVERSHRHRRQDADYGDHHQKFDRVKPFCFLAIRDLYIIDRNLYSFRP